MALKGDSSDDGGEQGDQRRHLSDDRIEEVAPHGEEPVEIVMNDQVFYHAGDLAIPARPDAGVDMRQGPSGPGPRLDIG